MKKIFFLLMVALITACEEEPVELSDAEQLQKDIGIIDQWLVDNKITAITDPSGIRYVISTAVTGAKPTGASSIEIKYTGKFLKEGVKPIDSKVFDQPSKAVTLKVTSLIEGLQIGVQLLEKGSKATFYVPSGLAYGKGGVGSSVPPNSNLFYDVDLIDVK